MDTRELLTHLERLEHGLNRFSYAELKSSEAFRLKQSFEFFKNGLEERVYGIPSAKAASQGPEQTEETNQEHSHKAYGNGCSLPALTAVLESLGALRETGLTEDQSRMADSIEAHSRKLFLGGGHAPKKEPSPICGASTTAEIPFNLSKLINDVVFICNTLVIGDEVSVNLDYDDDLPELLKGDPSKLSLILLHFLGNTVKSLKKGKVQMSVFQKRADGKEAYVAFYIEGLGGGAERADLLDWGMIKSAIAEQKGDLSFSNNGETGFSVQITLPFSFEGEYQILDAFEPLQSDFDMDVSGRSILALVSMQREGQDQLNDLLEHWGCHAFVTDDVAKGLLVMEEGEIDMVLLDADLMAGDGILNAIQAQKAEHQVPLVLISGQSHEKNMDVLAGLTVDDFVFKPLSNSSLKEVIYFNTLGFVKPDDQATKNMVRSRTVGKELGLNLILQKEYYGEVRLLEERVRLFEHGLLECIGMTKVYLHCNEVRGVQMAMKKARPLLIGLATPGLINACRKLEFECGFHENTKRLKGLFQEMITEFLVTQREIESELKKIKNEL